MLRSYYSYLYYCTKNVCYLRVLLLTTRVQGAQGVIKDQKVSLPRRRPAVLCTLHFTAQQQRSEVFSVLSIFFFYFGPSGRTAQQSQRSILHSTSKIHTRHPRPDRCRLQACIHIECNVRHRPLFHHTQNHYPQSHTKLQIQFVLSSKNTRPT